MPTVKELADAEAARAESEPAPEPEPEPEGEPEGEPEPEPEATVPAPKPETPEQIEKRWQAAGKRAKSYIEAVVAILGPGQMATLVASPLDAIPGLVQVDPHGQVNPEVKAETLAFLNVEPPVEYRQHPGLMTCPKCAGPGDLLTGATRKGNELTQCPDCGGLGYTDSHGQRVGTSAALGTVTALQPSGPDNGAMVAHGMEDPRVNQLRAEGYTVVGGPMIGGGV